MVIWIIVLIVIGLLCLLYFGGGHMGLRLAIRRGPEINIDDRESLAGTAWGLYYEPIMEGIRFIRSFPYEDVYISSFDGLKLHARLVINPEAKGTVCMFHGYRTHAEIDFSAAAHIYYEAGLNMLLIDQRASGESEGDYIGFGVLESRDAHDWAWYVCDRFGPQHNIILGGLSMGASTVLMAAGLHLPENVKGMVADSAFSSPKDIILNTIQNQYHLKGFLGKLITAGIDFWTRRKAGYALDAQTVFDTMPENTIPILFAHGEADSRVQVAMTQKAAALCRTEKEVLISPGAEHGTGFIVDFERYSKTLDQFLRKANKTLQD